MGTADLAFISMEQSQNRYASWVDLSEEISQLLEASLYYSFENHAPWTRTLKILLVGRMELLLGVNGLMVGGMEKVHLNSVEKMIKYVLISHLNILQ